MADCPHYGDGAPASYRHSLPEEALVGLCSSCRRDVAAQLLDGDAIQGGGLADTATLIARVAAAEDALASCEAVRELACVDAARFERLLADERRHANALEAKLEEMLGELAAARAS